MIDNKSYPKVVLKDLNFKSWWSGDRRVEPYMQKVDAALNRSGLQGQSKIDVYNRCYEAIYQAIIDYSKNKEVKNDTNT